MTFRSPVNLRNVTEISKKVKANLAARPLFLLSSGPMPIIELKGVSKLYPKKKEGDVHALRHVNLTIELGDVFGIIGSSGSGKSTLLRCLATMENPSFGEIFINDKELSGLSVAALRSVRKEMGFVFQHFNLFSSRTVWGNVVYPLEISGVDKEEMGRRAAELIGLVGLSEYRNTYPSQLSGGQKQRVGIARALANNPRILLCDEATSALDPKTTEEILTLIKDLKRKLDLTVVMITHEMEVVKAICNKVAVLDKGEIVEEGMLSEVFVSPKHATTKQFVFKTHHEIPKYLLSGKGKVVHLHFKGERADKPIITQMVKKFDVDANILLGWIDSVQSVTVGNLIIELSGKGVEGAIEFLKNQGVIVEEGAWKI